ncbi:MAG: DNA methylase, partial [Deltaproteobacteria bacterium]
MGYRREYLIYERPRAANRNAVGCLGRTFDSDEKRREYFLGLLREGLEELHTKLANIPFTTIEEAVEQTKSIEKLPMAEDGRLRELAKRMYENHKKEPEKDLLQLWKDEIGFPHGEIEDILNLSDPPYYTACPNPWIFDFISFWKKEKCNYKKNSANGTAEEDYHREPFAVDVSEGKNDPIYNAHSYHTKVPHRAIMRYILHYTEPGDIVFDGFCGTGMTGVAAQLCGDKNTVESLGYKVDDDGIIYQQEQRDNDRITWKPFSRLGERKAILNDLSPAATFIAYNYNTPVNVEAFKEEAERILKDVEDECGWMYATLVHGATEAGLKTGGEKSNLAEEWAQKIRECKDEEEIRAILNPQLSGIDTAHLWGKINYTVWSDVFICPECTGEVVFWDAAVDKEKGKVLKDFPCPHCGQWLSKTPANPKREAKKPLSQRRPVASKLERAWVTKFDRAIGQTIRQAKQVPVLINYSVGRKRYEKTPDAFDLALIEKIEQLDIPYWFPTDPIPEGDKTGEPLRIGITHVHHFYTKRNLWVLGAALSRSLAIGLRLSVWVTSAMTRTTKMYKYMPVLRNGKITDRRTGTVSGTLYIPSMADENSPFELLASKIRDFTFSISHGGSAATSTNSATDVNTSNLTL